MLNVQCAYFSVYRDCFLLWDVGIKSITGNEGIEHDWRSEGRLKYVSRQSEKWKKYLV